MNASSKEDKHTKKWLVSSEYWIEAENAEKAMEKFGGLYKEEDWTITEVANAEEVEDDLFVFFGSILERIREERKKQGRYAEEIVVLDSEIAKACKAYRKDHPRDYMLMAED